MGTDNVIFMEVLEWFDDTGSEVAHRVPEHGSGEFKMGGQVVVRDSQAAVFFAGGHACDALGPGRHTLITKNVPLLTKAMALPWGFTSPFRAEVVFVGLQVFANLKWGTRDPVAFRDREFGMVRLRAHGMCNLQVVQPVLFVNSLVGTRASYPVSALEDYVSEVIVSRLNDHLGEHVDTLLDLPSGYAGFAEGLSRRLVDDFARFGLALQGFYVNAITPPDEVQHAIDDRSRLGALDGRLDDLLRFKMAEALEKAADGGGPAEGAMGLGLGMVVPGLLGGMTGSGRVPDPTGAVCPECGLPCGSDARFCPHCGHQILVLRQCGRCGMNLGPHARFCPACGAEAGQTPVAPVCSGCGAPNRVGAVFCNRCGERLTGTP